MKEQTQELGIRRWSGEDLISLQSEPLRAVESLFSEYPSFALTGCKLTAAGNKYNISEGLVSVKIGAATKITKYSGATNVILPYYIYGKVETETAVYEDAKIKPVAYNYIAVGSSVKPSSDYIVITEHHTPQLHDAITSPLRRFVSDANISTWNTKSAEISDLTATVATHSRKLNLMQAMTVTVGTINMDNVNDCEVVGHKVVYEEFSSSPHFVKVTHNLNAYYVLETSTMSIYEKTPNYFVINARYFNFKIWMQD